MNDWRTKIALLAIVLGLGGLGGYAMSSNRRADTATTTPAAPPTKVIRRTVHVKPKHPRHAQAAAAPPTALTSTPVSSGTSGASSSAPISTGSSGSGGGAPVSTGTSGGGGGEGGGEHEGGDGGGD